jgi:transposase InsO family protein
MRQRPETTFVFNPANAVNLAIAKMGPGFVRSTPTSTRQLEVCCSGSRIFSKWVEAKPLATITSAMVQKFFWQNIVCRFGVPKAITVDNRTQFDAETFKTFYSQIGTKIHFASVMYPESNGLVERANGIIITEIMKSIFNQPKGKWPDELTKVVWNHNTIVSRKTRFTPFKLLFGDEAITPEEARTGSIRILASIKDEGDCQITKDTIEGTRLQAIEHINKY